MEKFKQLRVGALDIAELISDKIGSYVDMNFMQFVCADGDTVHLWYMNSGGKGPSIEVTLRRATEGWSVDLKEHPSGTEQTLEVP